MSIDCQSCFDHEQHISQIYADFDLNKERLEKAEDLLSAVGGVLNLVYARYKADLRPAERTAIEKTREALSGWRAKV